MPDLTIDGKKTATAIGATILDAAAGIGIAIPTLCHLQGLAHFTSCMVCLVKDARSGRLIPACSKTVEDGMIIETSSPDVIQARQASLELLLGEHVGDCEAPCQRACPARMNIPLMIRQIAADNLPAAIETVRKDIPLAAILGRICPAPCEKACRRGRKDQPVAICLLKRFSADTDFAARTRAPVNPAPSTGRKVAIVGAGPTGLSTAWFLTLAGHACTIFDIRSQPGGALRTDIPDGILPRHVLDNEIAFVLKQGVEFRPGCRIGADFPAGRLEIDFDAVVLATGAPSTPEARALQIELATHLGLVMRKDSIEADPATLQTAKPGIFAGGNAVNPSRMAVKAVAQGKLLAHSVSRFLSGLPPAPAPRRFNSIMGRMEEAELAEFTKTASADTRVAPADGMSAGFTSVEAVQESLRCLHCDCRKPDSCRLRDLAEEYHVSQSHYRGEERPPFQRVTGHSDVIYEPGKCIKCGICVRICERDKEQLGLTFIGRGFQVRVAVPFDRPLSDALARTAATCIAACPTGALARP